jgi:hypothetical protein
LKAFGTGDFGHIVADEPIASPVSKNAIYVIKMVLPVHFSHKKVTYFTLIYCIQQGSC